MPNMLKDKAVLVTGAGGGIGREMALLAAKEGASVVVNDLGGAVDGEGGGSTSPAQKVVDEIIAAGGKAVANGDSVADPAGAERMIKAAVENFGKIDGVINNAGILRDRIFHRMSHVDWKMVIDVHLHGAFNTSRAAANYFKEQKSGWSETSARRISPPHRWASSACRARSRSTWRPSTSARTASRPSPGRA